MKGCSISPFETQGWYAASSEPFAEWCNLNEARISVASLFDSGEVQQRIAWNDVLKNTHEGDLISAEHALAELNRISRQIT